VLTSGKNGVHRFPAQLVHQIPRPLLSEGVHLRRHPMYNVAYPTRTFQRFFKRSWVRDTRVNSSQL
jgi:hypothetical protein